MSDQRKGKPVLDEQSFSKLLEAAYVLQEHNRELEAQSSQVKSKPDQLEPASQEQVTETEYGITLAKIVETQHDIQVRHLDLENALKLVANRVVEITKARGAAIAMLEGKIVRYRAVAGKGTMVADSTDVPNKSLSASCLKTGKVFRCVDVSLENSLDTAACQKRGIGSLISAPIFYDGGIAGGLELYYPSAKTFTDQDVHTCRLMAGLVTEALVRDEEISWKKSLANERAAMLEALEKLQPNLAALIEKPQDKATSPAAIAGTTVRPYVCRKCGHELVREEQFCGQCGTPRASDYEPPSMQSKVASAWQLQESHKKEAPAEVPKAALEIEKSSREPISKEAPLEQPIEENVPEFLTTSDDEPGDPSQLAAALIHSEHFGDVEQETSAASEQETTGEDLKPSEALTTTALTHQGQWNSAASARAFLEKVTPAKHRGTLLRLWNTHRGDIYLGIAVVLVACVIGWGLWPDHSSKTNGKNTAANATHQNNTHRKSPGSDLSFFDRMLVQLGLAEAPPSPEEKGNPGVQVWVDLQTALYYCPGSDLYGKTPKGKFTTQRTAQLDQFEPAYRKACN